MKVLNASGSSFDLGMQPSKEPVHLEVQLSADGINWSRPVWLMVDTGNVGPIFLPAALVAELDLQLVAIDSSKAEFANGSTESETVVILGGIRFLGIPSNAPITILEVPAVISKNATDGLVGLDALALMNTFIKEGRLVLIELSQRFM